MSIATKLQTIYDGVEDVRDALQEKDATLGRGTIDTLGDDVRTLVPNKGYGVTVYGDVRTEEEVEGETEYTYTNSVILDSVLIASGDDLNTDVIDGLGELDGDMVTLQNGNVQIPLNTGTVITVDPTKVYVKFRDPVVENIVLTNWGTNGKITLAQVRAITNLGTVFRENPNIETFNEFKWFDGITMSSPTGSSGSNNFSPFHNCSSLKEIKIPRVADIGDRPFYGCTSLAHIELPDTLVCLGRGNCYGEGYFGGTLIEELVIPDSVVAGQRTVFKGMPNLKRLVWGKNLPFPPSAFGEGDSFGSCPNLEKIENFPTEFAYNTAVGVAGLPKLDFSNILPTLEKMKIVRAIQYANQNTPLFDYAPNGKVTFTWMNDPQTAPITVNNFFNGMTGEQGVIMEFPNWTYDPSMSWATIIKTVIFSENTTHLSNFAQSSATIEYIIPCTTPPTLSNSGGNSNWNVHRFYVPAASLEAYKTAENWSAIANKLRAYRDRTNADATFCSIPDVAPVPTDYTKVHYISNIDGTGIKNCQINNIGYIPKRYSQILLDFEHELIPNATQQDNGSILWSPGNSKGFCIRFSGPPNDNEPSLYRDTSTNVNYPNPMGLTLQQQWFFNSKVTGEKYGQRSVLKMNYHFLEYHNYCHQVDEVTGDATENLMLIRFTNNLTQNRKIKIYRLCMFEPVSGFTDVDDPNQYEIVRDYIPVMRNSDNKYGLYERLTDTFYPSTIAAAQFSGPTYE